MISIKTFISNGFSSIAVAFIFLPISSILESAENTITGMCLISIVWYISAAALSPPQASGYPLK